MWGQNNTDGVYLSGPRNSKHNLPVYKTYYLDANDDPRSQSKDDDIFYRENKSTNANNGTKSKSRQRQTRYDENMYALPHSDSDDEFSGIRLKQDKKRYTSPCCATKIKSIICVILSILGALIVSIAIVALLVRLKLIPNFVTGSQNATSMSSTTISSHTSTFMASSSTINISYDSTTAEADISTHRKLTAKTTIEQVPNSTLIAEKDRISQGTHQPTTNTVSNNWSNWEEWSNCTDTCGKGSNIRSRKCLIIDNTIGCEGNDYEIKECSSEPCAKGQCCQAITVSLGRASFTNVWHFRGDYIYDKSLSEKNGLDVYKDKVDRSYYLFRGLNHWLVGVNVTSNRGWISHEKCSHACPSKCSNNWSYLKNRTWAIDLRLKIKCEHRKCCMNINVSATGNKAINEYPESFGTYRYFTKDNNGGLVWRLVSSTHEYYLFRDHKKHRWTIFSNYDDFHQPFMYTWHSDVNYCPENAYQSIWRYYDNEASSNKVDMSITLTCADNDSVPRYSLFDDSNNENLEEIEMHYQNIYHYDDEVPLENI